MEIGLDHGGFFAVVLVPPITSGTKGFLVLFNTTNASMHLAHSQCMWNNSAFGGLREGGLSGILEGYLCGEFPQIMAGESIF